MARCHGGGGQGIVTANRKSYYKTLAEQATTDEAGGLAKKRSVLLLWFFRNVVGVGDIDAYDYVCDGDDDKGIDGLFIEPSPGDDEAATLVIYQSKYTEGPDAKVGDRDVDRLAGAAAHFADAGTVHRLLAGKLEPSVRQLIEDLGIEGKLQRDPESLRVRLVLVTSGQLHPDAKRKVENIRAASGSGYLDVWTIDELGPLAEAVRSPQRMQGTIEVQVNDPEVLVTGEAPNRVAITPVAAQAIAQWPGIHDRWLFALNVRHQLRANKVSKGLDRAVATEADHRDFLAYHNGLTVICDRFQIEGGSLTMTNPSVVNGAQSVLAFQRGLAEGQLTDALRVPVKVVEVAGRPFLEREVSRRSNTQTAVNPRNLMANSGPQLRLLREFETQYPGVFYETRPDSVTPGPPRVIRNDDAAQLLCAIFNEWPWLAVKKLSLFESDNHPHIFSERISAHHVVLADEIQTAVQGQKDEFPDAYRSSWRLTRLIACYLVGQIAREAAGEGVSIFDEPEAALANPDLPGILARWAYIAAAAMSERHDELGEADDFKKDFKNESRLKSLGASARKAYKLATRMAGEGS